MYKVGMLCKHFKGKSLLEKNIYKIIKVGVAGSMLDEGITYTGVGDVTKATDLVVYQNIFQDNMFFAREEWDLMTEIDSDKQKEFNQRFRVEALNEEEIEMVNSLEFIKKKRGI